MQVYAIVFDDARPLLSGTATITVLMIRNPSGPVFTQRDYNFTFNELQPVGYNVGNVSAPDPDGVSDCLTWHKLVGKGIMSVYCF